MSEKSDYEKGYDVAWARATEQRMEARDRIVELESRIAELEAENAGLKERVAMLDVTAVFKSLGEMGYIEQTNKLHTRIAELESLVEQLIWVGNNLLVSNTNPVTITLFNGLICNAKERER